MSLELDRAIGERLKFGEFELAPDARSLWRCGEQVTLGSRALDILIALASRPGQILSKDDLTKSVWRGAFVDETATGWNLGASKGFRSRRGPLHRHRPRPRLLFCSRRGDHCREICA